MRVPIPLVLLLSLAMIAGVWWFETRHTDFLTPPSPQHLAAARERVASSLPPRNQPDDTFAVPTEAVKPPPPPPPAPVAEPKPAIDPGDLNSPPTLQAYRERAPKGAAHLMELAVLLEAKGALQHALLAWERVLDVGKPNAGQSATAIAAIKRLRPTLPDWNTDRASALAITLHAGTGKKNAKTLAPLLEASAREMERASAGILKVTATVTAARDHRPAAGPAPVALWLTGPKKSSVSTEVRLFTAKSPESLRDDLLQTEFLLVHNYLAHATSLTPAPALTTAKPLDALHCQITRLGWQELGSALNRPPKKVESPAPKPKNP